MPAAAVSVRSVDDADLGSGDLDDRPGRPDAVSAAVAAQTSGVAVEDVSKRTDSTRVFAHPDGTWSSETASEPEQVQDGPVGADGVEGWNLIDPTLVAKPVGWKPAHTVLQDMTLTDGGTEWFASLNIGGHELRFGLDDLEDGIGTGAPVEFGQPVVTEDTAVYANVIVDGTMRVDLVVRASGTGFEHWWVIHQDDAETASAATDLDLGLTVTDMTAEKDGKTDAARVVETDQGGLRITAGEGKRAKNLAIAPSPVMWDATTPGPDEFDPATKALKVHNKKAPKRKIGAGGEPVDDGKAHVHQAKVKVTKPSSKATVKSRAVSRVALTIPADVLATAAAGPVTVDPSFTVDPNADTWVQYPDYQSGQTSSQELRAGTYDGGAHKARTFMRFNDGDALWEGRHVLSAKLTLRNWQSETCTGSAIRVSRVLSDWTLPDLTWSNQPNVGAEKYADLSTAYGANSTCPAGDATWDLTDMVTGWHDGFPNYGLRIKAVDETSSNTWRRYRSANYTTSTSLHPKLVVTYNSYPGTTSTPVASPGTAPYVTTLTPKVCFTVSDPDAGAKLRGSLEVYAGSTASGTAIWTWTAAVANAVSSGTNVCATIPTGKLTNGSAYTVRARAADGTDWSKSYSASKTFTVDTTKPAATITASGFTNGTWTTQAPASNTFTFNGPTDTKSFSVVKDNGAATTMTANTSGDATLSWLPTNGAHTLKVTPTDKAGNLGTTATFTFGVGAASLLSPNSDDRSTGVFAVKASGPPNATGAELGWRYAGESTWKDVEGATTTSGSAWSGTVSEASGTSTTPNLVWDASTQPAPTTGDPNALLKAPTRIELRTCFTYSGTPSTVCSSARPVQLVPSAFGGNFPTTEVGPASVALTTGEATITEPDAVDTAAGVGRTYATLDGSTLINGTTGAFGPGWSTTLIAAGDTGAEIVDHRSLDRTIVLVTAGGSSQMFTPVDPDADVTAPTSPLEFKPAGVDDGSRLVLDPTADPDTITLTRLQGAVTNWIWDTTEAEWVLAESTSQESDTADPEAEFTFDPAGGAEYPTWIAQTSPGVATTCTEQTQEPGCRGLKLTYTGTGDARRVSKIDRLTVNPDGTTATETVATYTYTDGLLTKVCGIDPDSAGALPSLCSSYAYDTTTVASRTLLAKMTPPGQKPWEFHYDTTGRLATVTRAQDENTTSGGIATWSIAYDLAPTRPGLTDMTTDTIARWGQEVAPVKAFAVFDPTKVPADRKNPTAAEIEHAQLWYTDSAGTTTNTAVHANVEGDPVWLVDTSWYDEHGNTIRSLDGAGRHAALATSTVAEEQRAAALNASVITEFNTAGTRVEAEYGPVQTATLKDGTTGTYRSATLNDYDDEEPTLGGGAKPAYPEGKTSFDMVVQTHRYATNPDMTEVFDEHVSRAEYSPLVSGDGNGWKSGTPTKTLVKLADGTWRETALDRYDTDGRQVETRQPGGATSASGAGADAHATVFSYYSKNHSDPDCDITGHANRAGWDGLPCKTGPAGQPIGQPIPVKHHSDYNADLQPTIVVETSAAVTRTTATGYDKLGRPTSSRVQVTGGGATNETIDTTVIYNPATGMPASMGDATNTISATTDTWGREWTSKDAAGLEAVTTYTSGGAVATFNDGRSLYEYSYDQPTGEHRNLLTGVDLDLPAGTNDILTIRRDARGQIAEVAYPNGMTATHGYNESGAPTALSYTTNVGGVPTELVGFAATTDVDGRVLGYSSAASTQNFGYDSIGRLTTVEDTREGACTTRAYSFSQASERTSLTTFGPAQGDSTTGDGAGACQATTMATSKSNTYDSANRITNDGYAYDPLGRTLTVPAVDSNSGGGSGPLQVTYHANDMVKSMTQQFQSTAADGTVTTRTDGRDYTLDPAGRVTTVASTIDGQEASRVRYEYPGSGDIPSYISTTTDGGESWASQRYVTVPGVGNVAEVSATATTLQLANLHGDIVATMDTDTGALSYAETDEFGNSIDDEGVDRRYGYLGTHQRPAGGDTIGGIVSMGARLYSPSTGLFLSPDPVLGGNANAYNYPADPVNELDLTGKIRITSYSFNFWSPVWWVNLKLNRSETANLAWGTGITFGALSWVGGKIKMSGWVWAAWTIVEGYFFYLSSVASYAALRGKCVVINFAGRKYIASRSIKKFYAPSIWVVRC
ncbi:RHS repeat-associated core domain-containing protein [Nocardioides sp. NPDC004968]|uniref:RHS repeat-associated core domain-containing protein n=1 Tax=Nocardioides sp. NPDC004968 TaxID=3155894 RepID=UPI0033A32CEB